jgi:hypothetical protein
MLSDAMLIPSIDEHAVGDEEDAVATPKLLVRNIFEVAERFRNLGQGVVSRVQWMADERKGGGPPPSKLLRSLR